MGLQPLGDHVLIEVNEERERVQGGIVLPESAGEKPTEGTVVSAGPGARRDDGKRVEMPVKQGDTVIFGKYAGTEVKVDGKEYKILGVSDILAVRE